jgi:hypothetical protein
LEAAVSLELGKLIIGVAGMLHAFGSDGWLIAVSGAIITLSLLTYRIMSDHIRRDIEHKRIEAFVRLAENPDVPTVDIAALVRPSMLAEFRSGKKPR